MDEDDADEQTEYNNDEVNENQNEVEEADISIV